MSEEGPRGPKCCIKLWSCVHSKIDLTICLRIPLYNIVLYFAHFPLVPFFFPSSPTRYRCSVILWYNAVLLYQTEPLQRVAYTNKGLLWVAQLPGRELCVLLHGPLPVHLQQPPVGAWIHPLLFCIYITYLQMTVVLPHHVPPDDSSFTTSRTSRRQ